MSRRVPLAFLAALWLAVAARQAAAQEPPAHVAHGSPLALPLVGGDAQPELLAQRTIERKWGLSDDSTYHEVSVPGWKSEGGAMALSFAVPGAGQMYAGERYGVLLLLGEALGIYEVVSLMHSGNDWDNKARTFAGNPNDTTSAWSFAAYQRRTGSSSADLQTLYQADPSLFYYRIGEDPTLAPGWSDYNSGLASRDTFTSYRDNGQSDWKRSRQWRAVLWINHLGSAIDAFRVARIANVPLRNNLHMHLKTSWSNGGPTMAATLEAKF